MASFENRPDDVFGVNSPCNLDNCPIQWSMLGYRPSLAANTTFLALFAIIGVVHAYLGFRWRSWGFLGGMLLGSITEVLGYIGRIMMWSNPFSYYGFMIQIICLTIAPVFFTASIYVTLSRTVSFFGRELSRFKPKLFYWIFIPCDIICLILQAAGGALSTKELDSNRTGIDISLAGLGLQVIVLITFLATYFDYMWRLMMSGRSREELRSWRSITFLSGLTAASIFILTRCAFRVAELKDGYSGSLFREEMPFIVLESTMIVLAGVSLMFGSPGLVFSGLSARNAAVEAGKPSLGHIAK